MWYLSRYCAINEEGNNTMEEILFHRNYIEITEINDVIFLSAEVEAAVHFERSQSQPALHSEQVGPGVALRDGHPAVRVLGVVLHQLHVGAPGGEGGEGGPGGEVGGQALEVAGNFPAGNR